MTTTPKYNFFGTGNGAVYFTNQAEQHFKLFVGPSGKVAVKPVNVSMATEEMMDEAMDLTLMIREGETSDMPVHISDAWKLITSL
jgi:hypothetical protein